LQGILGDAQQIRSRAFHYVTQLFAEVTRRQTAVLMLEDLHWADDGSLDLIDHLMRERPDLPILIVTPTRPTLFDRRPNWGAGPAAHVRLDLKPLSDHNSRRLVAEILRKTPEVPAALQDLIVRRAEGSPFYVEELIKMLIEDGVIVTGADHWQVELGRLAETRVPATLTGVLQARLDGLPPSERETLQQASVVGRVFWGNVVERLRGVAGPRAGDGESLLATSDWLGMLNGRELIFRRDGSAFAGTQEFVFKHAILHEVTYESVLKRLRRTYHAQVAECLIELSGERAGEFAGRIGEHYERAGEWARAAEWYGRAGKQAQDTYLPEAAIGYYQKALDFWKESGHPPDSLAQRLSVYEGLGQVLVYRTRYAEAVEAYTLMRAAAESAGDAATQARAWYGVSMAQSYQGDHRAALDSAGRAEAIASAANARTELAMALEMKGWGLYRLGEAEAALTLAEQMLTLATELGDRRRKARSLNLLGAAHNILGHYPQANRCWEDALAIFRELGDRGQGMPVLSNLGVIAEARGDYGAALSRYQEALTVAREIGNRDGEVVYLNNLGTARVRLREHQAAETDLRLAIQMAGQAGSWVLANAHVFLAEACLGQGKAEEALAAARRALILGQEAEEPEDIAAAWRALGRVAANLGRSIAVESNDAGEAYDAVACFAESLRVCTETGLEDQRARTLRAWATHELTSGDEVRGAAMWQEARDIFARLGAELEVERMGNQPVRSEAA
jgi:tetratricopeptide (TPR) repeat protein